MKAEHLALLDEEKLRNVHRNCLLKLSDPDRGLEAASLLEQVHAEFTRRAAEDRQSEFLPMLRCVGYNVRWHGLGLNERRCLLDWILNSHLPQINDQGFMAGWGDPGSSQRHRMLVETIATYLARYGAGIGMEVAASRWSADLAYLQEIDGSGDSGS